jgi:hypothetical protein
MSISDWFGFSGVTILLLAFYLNLKNKISTTSNIYLGLNVIGAGLACLAAILIPFIPFIILEACWVLVSLNGLLKKTKAN